MSDVEISGLIKRIHQEFERLKAEILAFVSFLELGN